jgi:hypothetical protein
MFGEIKLTSLMNQTLLYYTAAYSLMSWMGYDIVQRYDFVCHPARLMLNINILHSGPNINKELWEMFVKLTFNVYIPAVLLILYNVNI